jgi:hypothetical protein
MAQLRTGWELAALYQSGFKSVPEMTSTGTRDTGVRMYADFMVPADAGRRAGCVWEPDGQVGNSD